MLTQTLVASAKPFGDYQLLVAQAHDVDAKALRGMAESIRDKLGTAVVVLACVSDEGKVQIVCAVTKSLTSRVKAGEVAGHVAALMGGRGGGKPDCAMAGATDASKLTEALASVEGFLAGK